MRTSAGRKYSPAALAWGLLRRLLHKAIRLRDSVGAPPLPEVTRTIISLQGSNLHRRVALYS